LYKNEKYGEDVIETIRARVRKERDEEKLKRSEEVKIVWVQKAKLREKLREKLMTVSRN